MLLNTSLLVFFLILVFYCIFNSFLDGNSIYLLTFVLILSELYENLGGFFLLVLKSLMPIDLISVASSSCYKSAFFVSTLVSEIFESSFIILLFDLVCFYLIF